MGLDAYPGTGKAMMRHFSPEEARSASDVFEYGSHSFFFHQTQKVKGRTFRENVVKLKGEDEGHYMAAFKDDDARFKAVYEKFNDHGPYVFAYPQGAHDDLAEVLLTEAGYKVSVTSEEGKNYTVKYLPETLRRLKRVNVSEDLDLHALDL